MRLAVWTALLIAFQASCRSPKDDAIAPDPSARASKARASTEVSVPTASAVARAAPPATAELLAHGDPAPPLRLVIESSGRCTFEGKSYPSVAALEPALAGHGRSTLTIEAAPGVPYAVIINAMDAASRQGLKRISFAALAEAPSTDAGRD